MSKGKSKGEPETPSDEPNAAELIARFQLDTERLIEGIRGDHQRQIAQQERKVAALDDQWTAARAELAGFRKVVEDALHEMREGVKEAVNAQRQAVAQAEKASAAAAVFERLESSRPDFRRMVTEVQQDLGRVKDKLVNVEGTMSHLSKRIDEFELVATDYEDTKGTVRGLDTIVKDLNYEARQRKQIGATPR